MSGGGTRAYVGITQQKTLPFILPPPQEQKAIAKVLSDVDELIASLEKLIAKKSDIKTATMQQLLTGKKRLAGFGGKWENKKIEKVVNVDPENLSSNTLPDYEFSYISLEDVTRGVLSECSTQVYRSAPSRARRVLRRGDMLVSTVRPNLKSHYLFSSRHSDWICSTGFSVLRCKEGKAVPEFIYYQFFAGSIERQIDGLIAGSNYPAINSSDVKSLEIPVPTPDEQRAISNILINMDIEINNLSARLNKIKAIKQGVMQELLTGRTRLI